nr:hypothetical protein [Tanacetum cinerariifolium]
MNSAQLFRKIELVSNISNSFQYLEGSNIPRVQLPPFAKTYDPFLSCGGGDVVGVGCGYSSQDGGSFAPGVGGEGDVDGWMVWRREEVVGFVMGSPEKSAGEKGGAGKVCRSWLSSSLRRLWIVLIILISSLDQGIDAIDGLDGMERGYQELCLGEIFCLFKQKDVLEKKSFHDF